jgi:thiosulfate/3-mercaptopyruvate sulfurtransferase
MIVAITLKIGDHNSSPTCNEEFDMAIKSKTKAHLENNVQWLYPEAIVECNWLKDHIGNQAIRLYDCTTYLQYTDDHPSKPYDVCSGDVEYAKSHIPKSAYLDLQKHLSETDSPYSFTLPSLEALAGCFKQQGIGDPYHIVLYSRNGMQWATRVWWMLHVLGYTRVSILNGGLEEWLRLGLPTEDEVTYFPIADFKVGEKPEVFVSKERVLECIHDESCVLINALTEDIHLGQNSRYGRPGRVPNSHNIPFHKLINSDSGKFITPKDALKIFKDRKISPDQKIINYCGGGIAATLDAFVLYQLGYSQLFIYDNSMSEWAMDPTLPIETG